MYFVYEKHLAIKKLRLNFSPLVSKKTLDQLFSLLNDDALLQTFNRVKVSYSYYKSILNGQIIPKGKEFRRIFLKLQVSHIDMKNTVV